MSCAQRTELLHRQPQCFQIILAVPLRSRHFFVAGAGLDMTQALALMNRQADDRPVPAFQQRIPIWARPQEQSKLVGSKATLRFSLVASGVSFPDTLFLGFP